VRLTEKLVAQLTLRRGETERLVADDAVAGLRLRLRQGRNDVRRTWVYRYEDRAGVQRSFTTDAAGQTLAAARKWAGELQAARRLGRDPARERDAGKLAGEQTLGAVLRTYVPMKASTVRRNTLREIERSLLVYLKPLHSQPLSSISTATLSARLVTIEHENGVAAADNCRRIAAALWGWAIRQGLTSANPTAGVERRRLKARDRVLTADELKAIWAATAGADDYSVIVRMLLLSGMRASEVGDLQWSEVLSDRIVLPGERTKNGRAHTIPLAPQLARLLATRSRGNGPFVFGRTGTSGFSGWSKSKQELDARAGIQTHWVIHDLRRTLSTGLAELDVAPHIIEALLNHVTFRQGVAGTYNRARYEQQIHNALCAWEAHVLEIAEGRVSGDRVVPLLRA
jgi:integrase